MLFPLFPESNDGFSTPMTTEFRCFPFLTVSQGMFGIANNNSKTSKVSCSRAYDPTKGLSRAMDLRTDQVLKALEGELSVPAPQERSWIPWLPPRDGVLRFRSTQFINFHGRDKANKKLNRKVEVLFKPADLGLSAAAQVSFSSILPTSLHAAV